MGNSGPKRRCGAEVTRHYLPRRRRLGKYVVHVAEDVGREVRDRLVDRSDLTFGDGREELPRGETPSHAHRRVNEVTPASAAAWRRDKLQTTEPPQDEKASR